MLRIAQIDDTDTGLVTNKREQKRADLAAEFAASFNFAKRGAFGTGTGEMVVFVRDAMYGDSAEAYTRFRFEAIRRGWTVSGRGTSRDCRTDAVVVRACTDVTDSDTYAEDEEVRQLWLECWGDAR